MPTALQKALKALKLPQPPRPPQPPTGLGQRARKGLNVKKVPQRSYGPKHLKLFAQRQLVNDWCLPPIGFVGTHQSTWEWMIYAATWKKLGINGDPHDPPFDGRGRFEIQVEEGGGRLRKGGQVCDQLVPWGGDDVCFRIQTDHWHVRTDQTKRVEDMLLKTHTQSFRIVDVFGEDFAHDCSLEAAVKVVADALAGREAPEPGYLGISKVVRR